MSDNLCEELIVEIFARLPSKSLLRFRSVSKSLRSCIDSPDFIRKHTCRSPQRLVMAHIVHAKYLKEYGDAIFCTLHAQDQLPLCGYIGITAVQLPRRDAAVLGSCNGILLVFSCGTGIMSLWNPSIMRQLMVPDCPRRCKYKYGIGFGLGFDAITDDHKIVSIPAFGNGSGESSLVYATKTGVWGPIASPMPLYSRVSSRAFYLNGVLHWVVARCFTDSENVDHRYIMTLDLSTHVFGMIVLPNPSWETHQLATIQGSLAVISNLYDDSWVFVRRDTSWSVVLNSKTIKVEGGIAKVLELTTNGDLLLDLYWGGIQVYTPKTGALSTLVDFNDTSSLLDIDMYVETLHLLHMGTACQINHLPLQDKKATSFK